MKLNNKIAMVTGAAQGIGLQIATKFADNGAKVIMLDIKYPHEALTKQDYSQNVIKLKVDISKKDEIEDITQYINKNIGIINILVNNAGICEVCPFEKLTEEQWDRMLAINLKGAFFCCQAVVKAMKKTESGKIINIASIAGKTGGVLAGIHYSVSKAGLIMLTRCLARELAPFNINVNAVAPTLSNTQMQDLFSDLQIQQIINAIPLGRMTFPEDIANAVLFLASDEASFITGETINVNGGSLMD